MTLGGHSSGQVLVTQGGTISWSPATWPNTLFLPEVSTFSRHDREQAYDLIASLRRDGHDDAAALICQLLLTADEYDCRALTEVTAIERATNTHNDAHYIYAPYIPLMSTSDAVIYSTSASTSAAPTTPLPRLTLLDKIMTSVWSCIAKVTQ